LADGLDGVPDPQPDQRQNLHRENKENASPAMGFTPFRTARNNVEKVGLAVSIVAVLFVAWMIGFAFGEGHWPEFALGCVLEAVNLFVFTRMLWSR
jgi:hypothetical protein